MTTEGRPYARFRRALAVRSILGAETAAREIGRLGLLDALDYLTLLAAEAPDRCCKATEDGWHGTPGLAGDPQDDA
jgi:hypothetical protein